MGSRCHHFSVSLVASIVAFLVSTANGQIVCYEGDALPENDFAPWTRQGTLDALRWLDGGFFYQFLALGVWPGPNGQFDGYKRTMAEFTGPPSFFVTWREMNTCPRSDMTGNPAQLSASSSVG